MDFEGVAIAWMALEDSEISYFPLVRGLEQDESTIAGRLIQHLRLIILWMRQVRRIEMVQKSASGMIDSNSSRSLFQDLSPPHGGYRGICEASPFIFRTVEAIPGGGVSRGQRSAQVDESCSCSRRPSCRLTKPKCGVH